ncbi:choloylglycine hydrolase family protein [Pseudodesulfovibrio sp.]|uniref:choloylglycine hydrolase family protein n=1 Tax=Pseudodesulfovibrio sp. TaxID=2035812 RepID=UPI00261190BF|nr:choloylglycine hydrolase family protein [Pseudodesulfovibrio sp.]MDD3311039.1 choloylglycine hydrolase family protein [Pseudodesulfovibrio sp.]
MPFCIIMLILAVLFVSVPATACSDFVVKAKDGTVLDARSMDFAIEDQAEVVVYPRGKEWASEAPGKAKGLSWKQRYGFVGFSALGLEVSSDGMNEKGLSAKFLWLPSVGFQAVPKGRESKALAASLVPDWILGNFSTVAEVKRALQDVLVWGDSLPGLGGTLTIHVAVHDAKGDSMVAEWVDGKLNVYDNPLGIMTNEPPLPMQRANLRNYVNLSPWVREDLQLDGQSVHGTGNGSGMLGLPGDCTPPSRFVRVAVLRQFAYQPETADEAIVLARRLLEQVYVPRGVSRDKAPQGEMADYTQWSNIYDLTRRVLYFADYQDQTLRVIDLNKLDFTRSDYAPVPVRAATGNAFKDVTPR